MKKNSIKTKGVDFFRNYKTFSISLLAGLSVGIFGSILTINEAWIALGIVFGLWLYSISELFIKIGINFLLWLIPAHF